MATISKLPAHFVSRPTVIGNAEALAAFDELFDRASADRTEIIYDLPWPRRQFICHIADHRGAASGLVADLDP